MSAPKDIRREMLVASLCFDKAAEHASEAPTPDAIRLRINTLRRETEILLADVAIWLEG